MAIFTLVSISLLSITATSFYAGGDWDPAASHDFGVNEFLAMIYGHGGEGHASHDRHAGRGAHASGHPEMNQPWGPYAAGPQVNQPWGPYAAGPPPPAAPPQNYWVAHTGPEWDPAASHDFGVNEFLAMLYGHGGESHVTHDRHAGRGSHAAGHPEMNQPWGPYAAGPPPPVAAPQNHWVAHTGPEWDPAASHDFGVNEFLAMLYGHGGEGQVSHGRHAGRGSQMNQAWGPYAASPPEVEEEPEKPSYTPRYQPRIYAAGPPEVEEEPEIPSYTPRYKPSYTPHTRTVSDTTTISSFPRTTTSTFPRTTSTFGRTMRTIPRTTTSLPASFWHED